jgi:hypothetical protein
MEGLERRLFERLYFRGRACSCGVQGQKVCICILSSNSISESSTFIFRLGISGSFPTKAAFTFTFATYHTLASRQNFGNYLNAIQRRVRLPLSPTYFQQPRDHEGRIHPQHHRCRAGNMRPFISSQPIGRLESRKPHSCRQRPTQVNSQHHAPRLEAPRRAS